MPTYFRGLALQYYRGIGGEIQYLGPFADFNFFIGANNSGKSTILDFLSKHLPTTSAKARRPAPEGLDRHSGQNSGPAVAAIGIPLDVFTEAAFSLSPSPGLKRSLERLCKFLATEKMVWLALTYDRPRAFEYLQRPTVDQFRKSGISDTELNQLWRALTGSSGGSIGEHWLPTTCGQLLTTQDTKLPDVSLIPAIRQVGPKAEEFSDLSGRGLIDRLAEIQSPDHDRRSERKLFDAINHFLQTVTGKPEAQIEVPHNRGHILVHMDGKVLPLSSLGTGIHEVIMIASFCTIRQEQIVCIEEPEIPRGARR